MMADIIQLCSDDKRLLSKTPLLDCRRAQLPLIAAAADVKSRKAEERMRALATMGLVKNVAANRYVLLRDERTMPTLHHYGLIG